MYLMLTVNRRKKKPCGALSGFTLIEIAAVILILSILIGAYLLRLHGATNGGNTAAVKQQVLSLEGAAHNYAAAIGAVNYSGLSSFISQYTTATGNSTSILPQAYTSAGIPNAYTGTGILGSASVATEYQITESALPPDACSGLASFFSQHGSASCSGGTLTVIGQ